MKKYYNEDKYFLPNPDSDITSMLKSRINDYNKQVNIEVDKYRDLLFDYDQFITKVSYLLLELNVPKNGLSYAIVMSKLLNDGYFSLGSFEYKTLLKNELAADNGINVVEGRGCCRNTTDFCSDVLEKLGESNGKFYCYDSGFKSKTLAKINQARHVINLVKYKDNLYGYDITNDLACRFINKWQLKGMSEYSNMYFTYKPYCAYLIDNIGYSQANDMLREFDKAANKKSIDIYELKEMKSKLLNMLKDNTSTLNEFNKNTLDLKMEICNKLKEKRL